MMVTDTPVTGITHVLAEFALELDPRNAPETVRNETLRILLDCLGSAVGGLVTPAGRIATDLAREEHRTVGNHLYSGLPLPHIFPAQSAAQTSGAEVTHR